jgi:hypothetical protein
LDTAAIEQATGLKGAFNKEENVFKVSKPRSDVAIKVDGRTTYGPDYALQRLAMVCEAYLQPRSFQRSYLA